MIKITNLTVKNFLSTGNAHQAIRLDQHGLTLVLGSNSDAHGGISRNGAGKTTILQAISFGLFGKPITKIKADNLVNNVNLKHMLVTVEWVRDGTTYRVERGRKPQVLKFFIDGKETKFEQEEDFAHGENRHTQTEIERRLGMTHSMFQHVVALNTYSDPFLLMKAAQQREVMEELIGALQLSQRAEALRKVIAGTKDKVRDEEARVKATTEANARISATITTTEAASKRWIEQHEQALVRFSADIEDMAAIDFDAEIAAFDALDQFQGRERELRSGLDRAQAEQRRLTAEMHRFISEYERYEREVARIDPQAQVSRLEAEVGRKRADADRHALQANKLREELALVVGDLDNPDAHTCRSCGQGLSGTDHLATVLANLGRQRATIETKIAREEREQAGRLSEIEPIIAEIAGVGARSEAERARLNQQAEEAFRKGEEAGEAAIAVTGSIEQATAALEALGGPPVTTFTSRDEAYTIRGMRDAMTRDLEAERERTNPYGAQIAALHETVQAIDPEPLEKLQDLLAHQDLLLKLLTKPDSFIRKKIVDQNLAFLNSRIGYYLNKLGLPHEVKFQPDLTVDISNLGRDFDFPQLSRGESNRVIMATSWSFRDVWESLNESMNLYFIDEILDQGMDGTGAEAALQVLLGMARERGKNVFLISHRDDHIGRIDRTLLVRKTNNFSNFEEDVTA